MNTMKAGKDKYFTPEWILNGLPAFDLDPCTSQVRPFNTAKKLYPKELFDGLKEHWEGRVWLNPPYGSCIGGWMEKMSVHDDGIALTFARTETAWFHEYVWPMASAIYFFKGRITFVNHKNESYPANSGAPSCLIAYGKSNALWLTKFRNTLLPWQKRGKTIFFGD